MKLYKMIEIYLKYDNMHIIRTFNAFNCINNHVNSCIHSMLSGVKVGDISTLDTLFNAFERRGHSIRGGKITPVKEGIKPQLF